jgi:transcriptional regulator with XRE-family HTH domain
VADDPVFELVKLGADCVPVTLGEEIRRARELMGMTQDELAAAVSVSPNTVGNWENDRSSPRGKLAKIRLVLHMEDEGRTPDNGPPLHTASHAELLAEIARRIEAAEDTTRSSRSVPPGRYRWPKKSAPSRQIDNPDEDDKSVEGHT